MHLQIKWGKKMFKRLLVSAFLLSSSSAFAIETVVPPGPGLQAAIIAATDGDVIILQHGNYSNVDSIIEITKALTIKAESAAVNPVIEDSFEIGTGLTVPISKLTLQGIQFDKLTMAYNKEIDELEILDSILVYGDSSIPTTANMKKFVMMGSQITCNISRTGISASAGDIVFAGNSYCNKYGNPSVSLLNNDLGSRSISVIGNSFSDYQATHSLNIGQAGNVLIAGNRFVQHWEDSVTLYTGTVSDYYFIVNYTSSVYNTFEVRNNVFTATTDRMDPAATLKQLRPVHNPGDMVFENNLIDMRNVPIWVPEVAGEVEQEGMMEKGIQVAASIRGNIFVNYQDNILPSAAANKDLGATNNLCFNNGTIALPTDCGTTDGNLNVDPLLTDTVNYQLGSTSPAIDAGPVDAVLSDIDGTRNDMGPYGGSWSIDKFDAQREAGAVGPYIYPIIDASKSVANGNVQVKFISYGRQL